MGVWALSLAYKKSADFDEDRAKVISHLKVIIYMSLYLRRYSNNLTIVGLVIEPLTKLQSVCEIQTSMGFKHSKTVRFPNSSSNF